MLRLPSPSSIALGALCLASCAAPSPPPAPAPPPPPPARAEPPIAVEPSELPHDAQAKSEPPPVEPPAPAKPAAPRLYSKSLHTWIFGRPKYDERYIGYIRSGTSVALRSTEIVPGPGCSGGFYQVEPRGFICRDRTTTLTPDETFLAQSKASASLGAGPFPYRYAISNYAPMYNRVPSPAEQRKKENPMGKAGKHPKLSKGLSAHEDLATEIAVEPVDPIPSFLLNGGMAADNRQGLLRQTIPLGSMLSFTKAFSAEGRTWLFSADQTLVPADRVRQFQPSAFHGTKLGGEVTLPLAWMRKTEKAKYRKLPSGSFERTTATWPVRTFVKLSGNKQDGYLETADKGPDGSPFFIAEADATVADKAEKLPFGLKPDQKWIVVSITQGTLVAYEGMTPVFATLMSPGSGGLPVKGRDNVKASTTPTGTYNVTFKDRATTMSPDKDPEKRTFWIADVPHTQYFNPPFALHAAFWHERFGEPTSAGCVNVSPQDAETLFGWSDPQVPPDWQGATGAGAPENGGTTAIVVRR